MPEGDTIFRAAARVQDAIGGLVLSEVAIPRVPGPIPGPGVRVEQAQARGKYLLVHLDDDHVIVTHLRMTGSWVILGAGATRPPAFRLRVWLETNGFVAVCTDAPIAELLDSAAVRRHPGLRSLGPDLCRPPVDLDEVVGRAARLARRGAPIGDLLLDQRVAAGIGNVYKSEICFLHGLDPATPAERVSNELRRELFATGARLLQDNLDRDHRTTVEGARDGALWVYDRAGHPCRRCGTTIESDRTGRHDRVTTWCPTCQSIP